MKLRRPNLEALYREVDHYIAKKESLQPPRIGISANRKDGLSCIAETYVQAVLKAGGAPVLVPVITDIEALTAIVNGLDGLAISTRFTYKKNRFPLCRMWILIGMNTI